MAAATYYGHIISQGRFREGHVVVSGGVVVEKGFGPPPDVKGRSFKGLIIPGLLDMHTHLGDLGARGDLPNDLGMAVHKGGLKDEFYSGASRRAQVSSYRSAVKEVSPGVSVVLDFRERGLEGIGIAREALQGVGSPRVLLLGRPNGSDSIGELVESSDGFGIPSLDVAEKGHRELVRERGAIYSVHASELYREDLGHLLDLDPDLAVHMVSGSEDDWKALARAGIPVCVCPRANSAFGIRVPLAEMARAGLKLVLGTDNALSAKQDMWREMEAAWTLLRSGGMGGTEASRHVFEMATGRTIEGTRVGSALGAPRWWEEGWPSVGDPAMLAILRVPVGDGWMDAPYDHIVRFSGPEDVIGPTVGRNVRWNGTI